MYLKLLILLSLSKYLKMSSYSNLLSKEKSRCVSLQNCSYLNDLSNTKRFHFGTTTLLTLLHCHTTNWQAYVRCPGTEKLKSFMDKAELLPDYDGCGIENSDAKIAGGEVTDLDEYPWVALIKYNNSKGELIYGCHGNLINRKYVLTAAHCVDPGSLDDKKLYSVVLGEYDIRNKTDCIYSPLGYDDCNEEAKELLVESYQVHPDYNGKTFVNDIALIRMENAVELSDFIKPICLPPTNLISPYDEILWIAGWGTTENAAMNPVKVKAKFKIRKNSSCKVSKKLKSNQYCASSDGIAKTCPGDSGGPLMMRRQIGQNFRYFLIGVDSLGVSCLADIKMSVYTKVSVYIEWIITSLQK